MSFSLSVPTYQLHISLESRACGIRVCHGMCGVHVAKVPHECFFAPLTIYSCIRISGSKPG